MVIPHSKKSLKFCIYLVILSLVLFTGCRTKSPAQKKGNYNGIVLNYYKVFDDSAVIEPIIEEYESKHPGLTINYRNFSDFSEYQRVILNEMAEGAGPDIFSMQNTWFMSNYKKISPMPVEDGTPESFAGTFVDVAYRDLVRVDQNGLEQIYALPMTVDTLALYYNKAHFADRIQNRTEPSDTWEGIKEDVVLLNKPSNGFSRFEVSGIAMGRADNISRGVDTLYLLLLQFGAKFYNENFSEAIFAGQQKGLGVAFPGTEALKLLTSFADEKQKHFSWNEYMVSDLSGSKEVEAFARGQVSMMLGYSYTYNDILKEITTLQDKGGTLIDKKDIGIIEVPQVFDPDVSTTKRVTYASYFAETVSRNSQRPDIAWDFLVFLTNYDNLKYYFDKTHKPTSRLDMIDEQKKVPVYGVFASQIAFAESFPILDYYSYKDIFMDVIKRANIAGVNNSALIEAQEKITAMLPLEGLIVSKTEETSEKSKEESKKKNK